SPRPRESTESSSPDTPATAASQTCATAGRSPRSAQAPAPGCSTTSDAPPAIRTTAPYGHSPTGSSASFTVVFATAPRMTNTPHGDTAPPPRLDSFEPWDV